MNLENIKVTTETELICSEDGKNTYEVIKRLKGVKGDKAIIILLYPTRNKNNINADDSTLNHLVAHMQDMNLNEIRIINLFSMVVDNRLSAKGLQVDTDNLDYINAIMSDKSFSNHKFIIAWGTSMESSKACQKSKVEILNMFLKHNPKGKIYQIGTSSNKVSVDFAHPLFLGIRAKSDKWELEEVKIKQSMLKIPDKTKQ